MIAIIDYGVGNLRSVQKGFERNGHRAIITRDWHQIESAAGVVLPGVGAFAACMNGLRDCGLVETVYRVVKLQIPLLGICVGMQILFTESLEFGRVKGLDILPGTIVGFAPSSSRRYKVPHMGWNSLTIKNAAPHLEGVTTGSNVYFVHSYYPVPEDTSIVATTTEYGSVFASSIWSNNVFATQFHPEKSQTVGLRILHNFARIVHKGPPKSSS